ncbi:UNVERIFIED_CONTAM: oxidoreductase [Mumia flava]|nr:2-oxoglutarate and iron-dependent oxygenase domain-containing protein [Mumia flava]
MSIPLIDLSAWRAGTPDQRAAVAGSVDEALRTSGFLLLAGHGVPPALRTDLRAAASAFFALPTDVRSRYRTEVGGRGWIPSGAEANAFVDQPPGPADLKETWTAGWDGPDTPDDPDWFAPNVWPVELPDLEHLAADYTTRMRLLAGELVSVFATALGLPDRWFTDRSGQAPHSFNVNRYPSLRETGAAAEGQYRVAPHTDFGMVTILDRQPGYGGLQVEIDGTWVDAPYVEDAFTINIGDLLARWVGDRWRSTRHRVLPPPADDADEELVSLIYFFEADLDAVVEPLGPPHGGPSWYPPVTTRQYLEARFAAITV